ncbi:MAG: hypothetical protein E7018_01520 [Alphaproteobacteria bacterium]|nr:hypothetical protein [Alphaproteobacteria bacterium]
MDTIKAILEQNEFSFSDVANHLKNIQVLISQHPSDASLYLPAFYHISNDKVAQSSDLRPSLCATYAAIISKLSYPEIEDSFDIIKSQGNGWIITNCTSDILKSRPELSGMMYEEFKRLSENMNINNQYGYVSALKSIITASSPNNSLKILNESMSLVPGIQSNIMEFLPSIYQQKPEISEDIWKIITTTAPKDSSQLSILYKNLSQICGISPDRIDDSLVIIKQYILSSQNDAASLKSAYKSLESMRTHEKFKNEIDNIINMGLSNPNNSKESGKVAHRILGNYEELCSSISIGQRVEKDEDNPMGWKNIDEIQPTETCVLFLGGDGAIFDKRANGYLKSLEQLFQREQMNEDIALYSVVYDFGGWDDRDIVFNANNARTHLMQTHKRNVKIKSHLNDDTMNPRYIKKIFDTAFLPRISDKDGKRISTEEAMQNIRKLNIVAHCHGAYTFLKLEDMMTAKMKELGYTKQEQQQIQKQLLCVAHAPYCPLGISKSTLISFCSAQDDEVSHHNNFQTEIVNLNKQGEMTLSYFPERQGNVFICSSLGEEVEQHNFIGYDINQKGLSNEGKAILALSGKAIVNGVRGSIKNEPLADTETLICGQDDNLKKIFNKIKENGKAIYNKILYNSIQRHKVAQQTHR